MIKKFLLFSLCLIGSKIAFCDIGDVNTIAPISPKNNAFQTIVRSTNVSVSTDSFSNNLSTADFNLQHALQTIDQLNTTGGGVGSIATRYEQDGSLAVITTTVNVISTGGLTVTNVGGKAQITASGGSAGNPGGSPTQVQINNGTVFLGTQTLTMNTTSNILTVGSTAQFTHVSSTVWTNVSSMTFGNNTALLMSTSTNLQIPSGQILTNSSSVTVQGVITAGSNITLTPTAGILTISASGGGGGGGGYALEPATVTIQAGKGITTTTMTISGLSLGVMHIAAVSSNVITVPVSLSTEVAGNLPVTNLNSGTGASGSTFWRGDGTWGTPASGSGNGGVNSGTVGQMTYYAVNGTTVSGTSNFVNNTSTLTANATIIALAGLNVSTITMPTQSPGIMYILSNSSNVATSPVPGSNFQLIFSSGNFLGADSTLAVSTITKQLSAASIAVGTGTLPGSIALYELQANGTNYAGWVAYNNFPLTYFVQMPTTTPTNNQSLLVSAVTTTNGYYPAVSTGSWYTAVQTSIQNGFVPTQFFSNGINTSTIALTTNGTAALPSIAWLDVGLFRRTNNALGLEAGGSQKIDISPSIVNILGSTLTVDTSINVAKQTEALPSYSFEGDLDTGINSPAANSISINVGGIAIGTFTSAGYSGLVSSFPATTVSSGSYTNTNLTVDAYGRLTSASNGSAGTGTSVYNATTTAGFPFGFSASTGVFTSSITVTNSATVGSLSTTGNIVTSAGNITATLGTANIGGLTTTGGLTSNGQILGNLTTSGTAAMQLTGFSGNPLTTIDIKNTDGLQETGYFGLQTGSGISTNTFLVMGGNPSKVPSGNRNNYFFLNISTQSGQSGNVGIGVSNPSTTLQVGGNGLSVVTTSTAASTIANGVVVGGHIEVSSTTPTISSCGSTPNGSVVGNDVDGKITIGGGAVTSCTLTFAVPWPNAPSCPFVSNTAITSPTGATTTTTFTLGVGATFNGDVIMYHCGSWR